jgi:hypothetical protein
VPGALWTARLGPYSWHARLVVECLYRGTQHCETDETMRIAEMQLSACDFGVLEGGAVVVHRGAQVEGSSFDGS